MQVNMHEAKSQLSKLAEKAARGEKVVIARAGKPWVDLVPHRERARRTPGRLKGRIRWSEDFDRTPESLVKDFEGES